MGDFARSHPLRAILGYKVFALPQEDAAKILELCRKNTLPYFDSAICDGKLYICVHTLYARRLCRLADTALLCPTLYSEHGIPRLFSVYGRRVGIWLGLLLSAALIFLSGLFVWAIEIDCEGGDIEEHTRSMLALCGVEVGCRLSSLDTDVIENRVLMLSDRISWISINIVGTLAKVEIREAVQAPQDEGIVAANLMASKNGIIVGFEEVRGEIMVDVGQSVSEGELLVGGVIGGENTGIRYLCARGKVLAITETEFELFVPRTYSEKIYTGREKHEKYLIFFKKEIKFFGNCRNLPPNCDKINTAEFLPAGRRTIPVGIRSIVYREYLYRNAEHSDAELKALAKNKLTSHLASISESVELLGYSSRYICTSEGCKVSCRIRCIENIAAQQPVDLDIFSSTAKYTSLSALCTKDLERIYAMPLSHQNDNIGAPEISERIVKNIALENAEVTAEIFGSFDANVRMLEKEFSVSVKNCRSDTGDVLSVRGYDRQSVELAAAALEQMKRIASASEELGEQQVRYIIDMVRENMLDELSSFEEECICVTTRGKPIKAKTRGQQKYVDAIRNNTIVFGIGPAGTGKTFLAVAMAVRALRQKQVSRIILTRPAIEAGEKLGFLPGDLQSKIDPYLRPLYDALYEMMGAENYQRLLEKGSIEIAPLAYMRGRTLDDSFIILDEAQNATPEQMKMFLTRLGFNSKAIITGDLTQTDLPSGQRSGLSMAVKILDDVEDIAIHAFSDKDVVRHKLVQRIILAYEKFERKQTEEAQRRIAHQGRQRSAAKNDRPDKKQ